MSIEAIKKVLIVGSGTMGLRIGLQAAVCGYDVVLYDNNEEALSKALVSQQRILDRLIRHQIIDNTRAEAAQKRISITTNKAYAAKNADLVSESVVENVAVKQAVFAEFAPLFPSHTIITTNTSYLLPSSFSAASGRPELFCALHFHDVFFANVVDIMPTKTTAPWVVNLLKDFGKSLQQIPVVLTKEVPGYLYNNMLLAYLTTAADLYGSGAASIEAIDRSWMGNTKMPMGPFGMFDQVGLDTVWHIISHRKDEKSVRFTALLQQYINEGKLGAKTGEGFYTYPKPTYKGKHFLMG